MDAGVGDFEGDGYGEAVSESSTTNLMSTGLCANPSCTTIAAGVVPFQPRWQLYTDGATKRRWIKLPPGTKINSTSMDYWQFPVGTKLWKEFRRNGVRVETRFMQRTGTAESAWIFRTYAWKADQSDALPAPTGGVQNALGTPHDIPPQTACGGCHNYVKSRVLGFSAIQLDYAAPAGMIDIDDAIARGWFTVRPVGAVAPHFPVPGTAAEKAVLGYFHANCGHCHNSDSQLINRPMLRLEMGHLSTVQNTRAYKSSVRVVGTTFEGATIVAKPKYPDQSIMIKRMTTTNIPKRMPPLGVETPDATGISQIRTWITNLQ